MVDDDTEYHWRVETFRFGMPCGLVIPVIFGFSKFAKSDGLECGLVNYFAGEIQAFCIVHSILIERRHIICIQGACPHTMLFEDYASVEKCEAKRRSYICTWNAPIRELFTDYE